MLDLRLNIVQLYAWLLYHSKLWFEYCVARGCSRSYLLCGISEFFFLVTLQYFMSLLLLLILYIEKKRLQEFAFFRCFSVCAFYLSLLTLPIGHDCNGVMVLKSFDFLIETWVDFGGHYCFFISDNAFGVLWCEFWRRKKIYTYIYPNSLVW